MHKVSHMRPRYEVSYATLCACYLYIYIYIYMSDRNASEHPSSMGAHHGRGTFVLEERAVKARCGRYPCGTANRTNATSYFETMYKHCETPSRWSGLAITLQTFKHSPREHGTNIPACPAAPCLAPRGRTGRETRARATQDSKEARKHLVSEHRCRR